MAMIERARPTSEEQGAGLSRNMAAYESIRDELERTCMGKWVIVYESKHAGSYDSEEGALEDAALRFGWGPYHVRRVGPEPAYSIPAWRNSRPTRVRADHADR